MRQILWGLFKKIVVADNCATYVDQVFADLGSHSGSTLLLAAVLFTFQIYGDFSGYSDIAIGTAKLFGIKLMRNFNVPYFSRDIAEFWRRWHISLTTWFRDYVYIPLGGSRPEVPARLKAKGERREARYKKAIAIRNTFVIFLLSGLWHGANWTFVLWGAYHALLFVPLLVMNKNRRYRDTVATISMPDGTTKTKWLPSLKEAGQMLMTFVLAVIGWIIFRAENVESLILFINSVYNLNTFSIPYLINRWYYIPLVLAIFIMLLGEWISRSSNNAILSVVSKRQFLLMIELFLVLFIYFFAPNEISEFIYFQF
jgi:D-alanyl-lipoteichoic acid acyltransferase DltB (MBOAT superfamily)